MDTSTSMPLKTMDGEYLITVNSKLEAALNYKPLLITSRPQIEDIVKRNFYLVNFDPKFRQKN